MKKSVIKSLNFTFLFVAMLGAVCCFLIGCAQKENSSSYINTDVISISKTELLVTNEVIGEQRKYIELKRVVKGELRTIWKLDLPSDVSLLTDDFEINSKWIIINSTEESTTKNYIISLKDGELLKVYSDCTVNCVFNDENFLIINSEHLALYQAVNDTLKSLWQVPNPINSENIVKVGTVKNQIVVDQSEGFYVLDETSGKITLQKDNVATIGLCKSSNEFITDENRQLVFYDLENNTQRKCDLLKVVKEDTVFNHVYLLGRNSDNLLFLYATDLPHFFTGAKNYSIPSNYVLAAINSNTFELSWKLNVGKWEWDLSYGYNLSNLDKLSTDKQLQNKQLFHTIKWKPEGDYESFGRLAYIDLHEGEVIWTKDYKDATRANILSKQIGKYFYLRLDFPEDDSKSALVQFADGKLNKAI
jgi:hypothetical protein